MGVLPTFLVGLGQAQRGRVRQVVGQGAAMRLDRLAELEEQIVRAESEISDVPVELGEDVLGELDPQFGELTPAEPGLDVGLDEEAHGVVRCGE